MLKRTPALSRRWRNIIKLARPREASRVIAVLRDRVWALVNCRVFLVHIFAAFTVFDPELVFQVTCNPGFADNVLVEGHVGLSEELEEVSGCYSAVSKDSERWGFDLPIATETDKTRHPQKDMVLNRIATSSLKSALSNSE
jgi:hypothetical protein